MVNLNHGTSKFNIFKKSLKTYIPKLGSLNQKGKHYGRLYSAARNNGLDVVWEKFKKDMQDGNIPSNPQTSDEIATAFSSYMASYDKTSSQRLSSAITDEWNAGRSDYISEHGSGPEEIKTSDFAGSQANAKAGTSAYAKSQQSASRVEQNISETGEVSRAGATSGTTIEGLGTIGPTGQLGRGLTRNIGGGLIDTTVQADEKGDYVALGPKSATVATKNLRASLEIAGGEDVRPSAEENAQSNTLFEAFSWVPDGYGLGPYNHLHLMNKQNDQLRFGMEEMFQPRLDSPANEPRPMPRPFQNDLTFNELESEYARKIGLGLLETATIENQSKNPIRVIDNDYNLEPGSQDLPRQQSGPSPYIPVIDTHIKLMPARDPPGLQCNAQEREDSYRGSWRYKRQRVFSDMIN